MDGLAVIGAVLFLIVVGYIGVSAVLRRIPATSLRLPTGPIPDTWDGIVEHNVPLARGLSSDERERLLRLVQVFLTEKHFEGCGGLTLTEEMKVTIAAGACLLLRSEEHTSELQSQSNLVCRLLLDKKKKQMIHFGFSH